MATRFYLSSDHDGVPAVTWDAGWEKVIPGYGRALLSRRKVGGAWNESSTYENVTSTTYDVGLRQFVSAPLAAQTIAGTVKGIIRVREGNAAADFRAQMLIRVVSQDGGTVRGTLLAFDASALSSEWDAATLTNRKFPLGWTGAGAALSSLAIQYGDRIVVEVGFRTHNASATAYYGYIQVGDTAAVDCAENETDQLQRNPWIEFSQDLVFADDRTLPRREEEALMSRIAQAFPSGGSYVDHGLADHATTSSDRPEERIPLLDALPIIELAPEPETNPPVVSNVAPTEGTPIARASAVFFDVTDDSGIFRRIIVTASFPDGSSEVVHDGDNFATRYAAESTRTVIPDGFRYRVRRTGGWPYGPTIRAFAIDTSGNENN